MKFRFFRRKVVLKKFAKEFLEIFDWMKENEIIAVMNFSPSLFSDGTAKYSIETIKSNPFFEIFPDMICSIGFKFKYPSHELLFKLTWK